MSLRTFKNRKWKTVSEAKPSDTATSCLDPLKNSGYVFMLPSFEISILYKQREKERFSATLLYLVYEGLGLRVVCILHSIRRRWQTPISIIIDKRLPSCNVWLMLFPTFIVNQRLSNLRTIITTFLFPLFKVLCHEGWI